MLIALSSELVLARVLAGALKAGPAAVPPPPGEGPAVEVTWRGPAACPRHKFVDLVRTTLATSSSAARASVTVQVSEDTGEWSLALGLSVDQAPEDTRQFRGPSCDAVVGAAAVVVAVAVDPTIEAAIESAVESAVEPAPAPEPEPAPEPPAQSDPAVQDPGTSRAPPDPLPAAEASHPELPQAGIDSDDSASVEPSEPRPDRRAPGRPYGQLRVAPLVDGGSLPGVSPGVAVALGGTRGLGRGEVVASYRAPSRALAPGASDLGGELWLWTLGARGCLVPELERFSFPLCAGLDGGQVVGTGVGAGLSTRRSTRLTWLAVALSPGVLWSPHPNFALGLLGEFAAPLFRHRFVIDGLGPVHRLGAAQIRGLLALEVRFP